MGTRNKKTPKKHGDGISDISKMSNYARAEYIASVIKSHKLTRRKAAELFGMSSTYITFHLRLLELPEAFRQLIDAYSITLMYKLAIIYSKKPEIVSEWIANNPTPTKKEFLCFLQDAEKPNYRPNFVKPEECPFILTASHYNQKVTILLNHQPTSTDGAWIRLPSGLLREVELKRLKKLQISARNPLQNA